MKENLKQQILGSPTSPGIYQFFDFNQKALYIGKARNLRKRLSSYTDSGRLNSRIRLMVEKAHQIEIIQTATEAEALLLECNLIKKLMPRYNILLRDDKSFPYIMITKDHEFGEITKHRGKRVRKAHYFGPFANISAVNETIDILKKSFLLRSCADTEFKNRKRPCLEYQIKRCSAPCVSLIDKKEYDDLVDQAVDFLNGKTITLQEDLAEKMQFYSQNFEYEKAGIIRDRIKALAQIQAKQNINIPWLDNTDLVVLVKENTLACILVSFYRNGHNYGSKPYFININEDDCNSEIIDAFLGQFYLDQEIPKSILTNIALEEIDAEELLSNLAQEKISILTPARGDKFALLADKTIDAKKYLEEKLSSQIDNQKIFFRLKELFDLPKIPARMEVYDNSHTSGEQMIGAMITAGPDGFIKNAYRKFNIRTADLENKDDTAMLKQVLTRRFKNINQDSNQEEVQNDILPDLVIIDGGLGQLTAAAEIFSKLTVKIPFISMSKGSNRNAGEEFFHQINKDSFTLPKHSPLMHYLQRLRDEAHRFAIGTHRTKRAKSLVKSELDEILGIGKNRKTLLLNYFGSVKAIKEAGLEDLERVKGINKNIALKIRQFFNKS